MSTIYFAKIQRMRVWTFRIRAESDAKAIEIAEEMSLDTLPNDDFSFAAEAMPARDQSRTPDNE